MSARREPTGDEVVSLPGDDEHDYDDGPDCDVCGGSNCPADACLNEEGLEL